MLSVLTFIRGSVTTPQQVFLTKTDYFIAYSGPPLAGMDMDSTFMWIPFIFKFSALVSLSLRGG